MAGHENFTVKVRVPKIRKVDKPEGKHVTVCIECDYTCCNDCISKNDDEKNGCRVMSQSTGYCRVCPNKCHWTKHANLPFTYE